MTHSNPLVVEGAVGQPLSLDADDLARLDGQIPDVGTVVAGRSGAAVPLASNLAAASPTDEATHLTLESTDGAFAASLPIELLEGGLLLYRLGDEPLPPRFGGPFRFLLPHAVQAHVEVERTVLGEKAGDGLVFRAHRRIPELHVAAGRLAEPVLPVRIEGGPAVEPGAVALGAVGVHVGHDEERPAVRRGVERAQRPRTHRLVGVRARHERRAVRAASENHRLDGTALLGVPDDGFRHGR